MDQQQAAKPAYDRAIEDVGNIVEFGHVNLRVPDQSLATLFYVAGLGLTRDPYLMTSVENMWINAGAAQFHLPSSPPQVLRGVIGLVVPDLSALRTRLQRVGGKLRGTQFAVGEQDGAVTVTCPWGNKFRVHAPQAAFGPISLGVPYVEFATQAGSAAGIVRFYQEILGGRASLAGGVARIGAGPFTTLIYRETNAELPAFDGHHIQISLADFSAPYRRLLERGLVSEESDQHQYRFQALIDPSNGEKLVEVEHEVRSMHHPLFARPLVNRNAAITNMHFAPGREAWAWGSPPG